MLAQLNNRIRRTFCVERGLEKIYDMIFQVKDVTVIRGIGTQTPYFLLERRKVELDIKNLIFNYNMNLQHGQPMLQFLDRHMNVYHPSTPFNVIVKESFYVRHEGYLYFIMNNLPLVENCKSSEFQKTYTSEVIEAVCRESLEELPEERKEMVSGPALKNLLISNMLKYGMEFKVEKIRYKELQKIVNRLIGEFQNEIETVNAKIEKRAAKRVRWFTNFLLAQYGLIHYFIYFHLSWDILEPITCILANLDLFLAYYFFIIKNRDWSLGQMHQSYIQKKKMSHLRKNGVNVDKYEELLSIREYIDFRLSLLSKSPYKLCEQLDKPITLLNTH